VLGIDANEFVGHPDITTYFGKIGMMEAILYCHGPDAPLMHQYSSQAIDGIFITPGLLGHHCGYLGGLE